MHCRQRQFGTVEEQPVQRERIPGIGLVRLVLSLASVVIELLSVDRVLVGVITLTEQGLHCGIVFSAVTDLATLV